MKSKRSPLLVITDERIPVEMHFFSDGGSGVIITCKKSDLLKLTKEAGKKKSRKMQKLGRLIHLSPEVTFFIK